jgi:pilus assembly protein CpaB
MNIRAVATLAVALCLGLLAVLVVRGYLVSGSKPAAPAASGGSIAVVVAASPISRGEVLEPGLLKIVNYPSASVPVGSFQAEAQLIGTGTTARVALRPMAPDEPVLTNNVSLPGAKATLSEALTPGFRAVSLRSSDVAGVGGFVLPGDRVDVLLTRTGSGAGPVTQALAENVLVLGVDQSDDQQANKPVVAKAVTIEVTPEQAQAISLGEAVGSLSLSLRHVSDQASLNRKATTVAQLNFGPPPAPRRVAHVVVPGLLVRVTRGVEVSNYTIGSP